MVLKCGVIVQCSIVYGEETNIRYIFVAPLLLGVGKPPSQKLRSRHLETVALIIFMPFVAFVYREWLGHLSWVRLSAHGVAALRTCAGEHSISVSLQLAV